MEIHLQQNKPFNVKELLLEKVENAQNAFVNDVYHENDIQKFDYVLFNANDPVARARVWKFQVGNLHHVSLKIAPIPQEQSFTVFICNYCDEMQEDSDVCEQCGADCREVESEEIQYGRV